jgi:hypothetical protein
VIPDELLEPASVCRPGACVTSRSTGSPQTDLALLLTSVTLPSCNFAVAAAYTCRRDQHDRPVAGAINVCPDALHRNAARDADLVQLLLHEVAHVLGFNAVAFAFFRDCNATNAPVSSDANVCPPRTPRDGDGMPLGFPRINENTVLPPNPLAGRHLPLLVTPAAATAARHYLGCTSPAALPGAPLQGSGADLAHWAPHAMPDALMAPGWQLRRGARRRLSALTLGLLADTGWYQVNASALHAAAAQSLPLPPGHSSGCPVGRGAQCPASTVLRCETLDAHGCHGNGIEPAVCRTTPGVPACRQWVPSGVRDCSAVSQPASAPGPQLLADVEQYGADSRCFPAEGQVAAFCLRRRCRSGMLQAEGAEAVWATCLLGHGTSSNMSSSTGLWASLRGLAPLVGCRLADIQVCRQEFAGPVWSLAAETHDKVRVSVTMPRGGDAATALVLPTAAADVIAETLDLCPGQLLPEGYAEPSVLQMLLLQTEAGGGPCPDVDEVRRRAKERAAGLVISVPDGQGGRLVYTLALNEDKDGGGDGLDLYIILIVGLFVVCLLALVLAWQQRVELAQSIDPLVAHDEQVAIALRSAPSGRDNAADTAVAMTPASTVQRWQGPGVREAWTRTRGTEV